MCGDFEYELDYTLKCDVCHKKPAVDLREPDTGEPIIKDDELIQINECLTRRGFSPVDKKEAEIQLITGNVMARYGWIVSKMKKEDSINAK